jgi:hypothetical protein
MPKSRTYKHGDRDSWTEQDFKDLTPIQLASDRNTEGDFVTNIHRALLNEAYDSLRGKALGLDGVPWGLARSRRRYLLAVEALTWFLSDSPDTFGFLAACESHHLIASRLRRRVSDLFLRDWTPVDLEPLFTRRYYAALREAA